MAGEDDGATLVGEAFEDAEEFAGQLAVEVGGRFIGDEDFRIIDQRAADGDTLLFAAGEPFHFRGAALAQIYIGEQGFGLFEQCLARLAGRVGRQDDVLDGGEAANQVELLEDEAEGLAANLGEETFRQAGNVRALEPHAPFGRAGEAAEDGQQCGLARARRAAQGRDLPFGNRQVDAIERPVFVVLALIEGLADLAEFEHFGQPRITVSGSVIAARQIGTSTAAV